MTLEAIKSAIGNLGRDEQRQLLEWLDQLEQSDWDAELARDFSAHGPGMPLLQKIKKDIQAGKYEPMGKKIRNQ